MSNKKGNGPKNEEHSKVELILDENNETKVATILEPLKILGATKTNGEMKFLVQWKGADRADLVAAEVAKEKFPQLVIQFYEQRLYFHSAD